jgi:hypothetical protein
MHDRMFSTRNMQIGETTVMPGPSSGTLAPLLVIQLVASPVLSAVANFSWGGSCPAEQPLVEWCTCWPSPAARLQTHFASDGMNSIS